MKLSEKIYEIYKVFWMLTHGFTFQDLQMEFKNALEEYEPEENEDIELVGHPDAVADYMISHAFEGLEESGFSGGSLWVCYDEFMDEEYRDKQFIRHMLTVACRKDLFDEYIREEACGLKKKDSENPLY